MTAPRCAILIATGRVRSSATSSGKNPHDPDAKIGRTKDGATDMVYLPEQHPWILDTGAIVQAQVLRRIIATAKS